MLPRHAPQSTSGASDTIFMKFFSRSSRATGPKMRVPRGFIWLSISTAAFSSKPMYVPSLRPQLLLGAHHHGLDHVALLDAAARGGRLDRGDDDVAHLGVPAPGPAFDADAQDLPGAGVVGHLQSCLHLDHLVPLPLAASTASASLRPPLEHLEQPPALAWRSAAASRRRAPCRPRRPRCARRARAACWTDARLAVQHRAS